MSRLSLAHLQQTATRVAPAGEVAFPLDVFENDAEILLLADLPGVTHESLVLQFEAGELLIEATAIDGRIYRRHLPIPASADASQAKGVLAQGVLTIHLPKAVIGPSRRIHIRGH